MTRTATNRKNDLPNILSKCFLLITYLILWLFHPNAWASKHDHLQIPEKLKTAKTVKKNIVSGDNLTVILRKAGFSNKEIHKTLQKNPLPKKFKMVIGEFYLVLKSPAYTMLKFLDPYVDRGYIFWKIGKNVGAHQKNNIFQPRKIQIKGQVVGSLIESINKQTKSPLVAYRFMDAFKLDGAKMRRLQKGDRFSFTYEKLFIDDIYVRDGEMLEAHLETGGERLQKSFLKFDDGGVFVGTKKAYKDRPLYSPVGYISISSPFNPRRMHPIKRRRMPHWGTDFVLPPGSPVFAAHSGKITRISRSRGGGQFIRISGGGFETTYNHLLSVESSLKRGDRVSAGTIIGKVGCSGYCTKPHLHFQVKKGQRIVDPAKYIKGFPLHYEKQVLSFRKKMARRD